MKDTNEARQGSPVERLVGRLRAHALPDPHDEREVMHAPLLREAADEIERLRSQLAISTRGLKHCAGWNISDDKRSALMAVVFESENMLCLLPNA